MSQNPVFEATRSHLPHLTKSEARIARYIPNNEAHIGLETGGSLAKAANVSEITVSRFLNKLGLQGMRAFKEQLKTASSDCTSQSDERFMRLLSSNDSAMIEAEARNSQAFKSGGPR